MMMEGLKWNACKYEKRHVHPGKNTDNNTVSVPLKPNTNSKHSDV